MAIGILFLSTECLRFTDLLQYVPTVQSTVRYSTRSLVHTYSALWAAEKARRKGGIFHLRNMWTSPVLYYIL
jgi:hypothetical protein